MVTFGYYYKMPKNTKNTKETGEKPKKVLMRVLISSDHFEALRGLEERTGFRMSSLISGAMRLGVPELQRQFAARVTD